MPIISPNEAWFTFVLEAYPGTFQHKEEFEVVCNTFHSMSAQGTSAATKFTPTFKLVVQYHIDKQELSGNTLTRIHKRARGTFFSPEGTKDKE